MTKPTCSKDKEIVFLKKVIKAQDRLLVCYRLGSQPPEWVFDTMDKFRKLEEDKHDQGGD